MSERIATAPPEFAAVRDEALRAVIHEYREDRSFGASIPDAILRVRAHYAHIGMHETRVYGAPDALTMLCWQIAGDLQNNWTFAHARRLVRKAARSC